MFGIAYLTMLCFLTQLITFKFKLDKFWQHQPILYDFKAEILGTGRRKSQRTLKTVTANVISRQTIKRQTHNAQLQQHCCTTTETVVDC